MTAGKVHPRRALPLLIIVALVCVDHRTSRAEPRPGAVVPVPYMLACGATEELNAALGANGEAIAARGAAIGGPLTQFWVNPTSREWSVVFVDPVSGQSCLVAAGADFKAERPAPKQPDPPKDRAS